MPVWTETKFQVRAYNASGAQLYLNGADSDSYMHRTFPNYRQALEYVAAAPKSAFRWTDDGFKRNRVASFDVRPADPREGNIEPMSREAAAETLAWLDQIKAMDAPVEIEETETVTDAPASAHAEIMAKVADMQERGTWPAAAPTEKRKPVSSTRTTEVVHPDGTTSTRKSKTMDYTHAIEAKEDMHAKAKDERAKVAELAEFLAAFERAVATGRVIEESEPWGRGLKGTRATFHAEDPETGQRAYLGSEVRKPDGTLEKHSGAFNLESAVAMERTSIKGRHAAALQRAEQMEAGPQFTYGVMRWSQSLENATKAMGEFAGRVGNMTFRVVEAHEPQPKPRARKAPAKPASKPAATKPKTALEKAKAANAAALKALLEG